MKILLATNNKHKVQEIKKILNINGLKVLSLADLPEMAEVKESGRTFASNAAKKASAAAKKFKMICVADDSGLCVDALNGRPGVRSARYVAPPVTPERLCGKLLNEMKNIPLKKRQAAFVCSVAIAIPGKKTKVVEGICRGKIIDRMLGEEGFGYDPVFVPAGHKKTFAQMAASSKNRISHRGKAFRKAASLFRVLRSLRTAKYQ